MAEAEDIVNKFKDLGLQLSTENVKKAMDSSDIAYQFLKSIYKNVTNKNIISDELFQFEKELSEIPTDNLNESSNFLIKKQEILGEYYEELEKQYNKIKQEMKKITELKIISADIVTNRSEVENILEENIGVLVELEANMKLFTQCCAELYDILFVQKDIFLLEKSMDNKPTEEFDEFIKTYIFKQFDKKYVQGELKDDGYLIAGPTKEEYENQVKDLTIAVESLHMNRTEFAIKTAKLESLKAVINKIENEKLHGESNETDLLVQVKNTKEKIAKLFERKSEEEMNTTLNTDLMIKSSRLKHYLECKSKLLKLLEKQYELDLFLFAIAQIEKFYIDECTVYLEKMRESCDRQIYKYKKDIKSITTLKEKTQDQTFCDSSMYSTLSSASAYDINNVDSSFAKILSQHKDLIELKKKQLSYFIQSVKIYNDEKLTVMNEIFDSKTEEKIKQLNEKLEALNSKVQELQNDIKIEMKTFEEFPQLHLKDKAWALVVSRPEELQEATENAFSLHEWSQENISNEKQLLL